MPQLLVGPQDLHKSHSAFLGVDPTATQARIYDAFPDRRGVASSDFDISVFEATVIMALVQTYTKKTQPDPFRVYMFVPPTHEKWVVDQLQAFAGIIFKRIKERRAPAAAQAMGRAFRAVLLGCRVLQFDAAPERWVAYGFADTDPIPEWMRIALGSR